MPGIFDNNIIAQIQQANDIVDVVSEHVGLKRKGREMLGLCPFHEDHRPSLNVSPAKQIFKCFACGAGGDVFKFVQMRENLSFPQAIERLAERAGIRIKPIKTTQAQKQTPDIDRNQLAKVNARAAVHFHKNLSDDKKGKFAREYLAQRNISPESIKKWQLGLAVDSPDDLLRAAKAANLPTKLLEHAGLVTANNQDKFINRLMFPITDVTGRVIGFGGRTLSNDDAKYINSPATPLFDKSNCLYGLQHARHDIVSTDTAVVVEGYTDCIMAHQFGISNVLATLGTSFTTGHGRILRRFAKKVVLIFDSDAAGIEAANRALEVCLSQRIDIKLAFVPQGKDPCDFLLTSGKEPFQNLIGSAVDVLHFKWDRLKEKFDTDDSFAGRKAATDEFLQSIATAISAGSLKTIEGGLLVNRLSKIIGLDNKQILAILSRAAKAAERTKDRSEQNKDGISNIDFGQGLAASAQREILEVLLNKPKLFDTVKQKISLNDFDVPVLKQIAQLLFETLASTPNPQLTDILMKTDSTEIGNCITELEHTGSEKENFEIRLTDAVNVLLQCQARRKTDRLKAAKDDSELLRHVSDTTAKQNRHNIGMT